MSVTHISDTTVDKGVFNNSAVAFTVTAPGIVAGKLAVVEVATDGNPVTTVTDSRGNTWTVAVQKDLSGVGCTAIAYSILTTGLSAGDTVSVAATNNRRWWWSLEQIDNPNPVPVDATASATGLLTSWPPSWTHTDGIAGDTVVSSLIVGASPGSYNGQTGWTILSSGDLGAGQFAGGSDYLENAATPLTVSPSFAVARNWSGVSVGFIVQAVSSLPAITTQVPAEPLASVTSTSAIVTQDPSEPLASRTDSTAIVTQDPVEPLTSYDKSAAIVTQDPVEPLATGTSASAIVTQDPVEVLVLLSSIPGGFLGRLPLLGAG